MLILGISGGFDPVHESHFGFAEDFLHDAAAVLVQDGEVVAGIEEERLNRIKHSNKIWAQSVRFCLESHGCGFGDLDAIAVYAGEEFLSESLRYLYLHRPEVSELLDARGMYQKLFQREFGVAPAREQFRFVHHHLAHAFSAYYPSGFEDSLILTIDGAGDDVSTMLLEARDKKLTVLRTKPVQESLGFYYLDVIRFLGYGIFDEYKVMGLAPYGDPNRYRNLFQTFYSLLPDGDYAIHKKKINDLYNIVKPRQKTEEFAQIHKDISAALQESLEAIVFHVLAQAQKETGQTFLCIAGGVGQNSSMNGKILASGLFRDVFVPPAAADSGCAIGAALAVTYESNPNLPRPRLQEVYWGTCPASDLSVQDELEGWKKWVKVKKLDHVAGQTAELMAQGAVIGWVQGRSEFGPRALGNRSILADPRPARNKDIINAMIKKREAYRPFAPSVLAERVEEFFVVPGEQKQFPFMAFVLNVRNEWREKLGAITHVDGTARLQTVSKTTNPRYWELIHEFGRLTGVPILLNTSFNNNAEPIVDSVEDAVVCFLTSGLHFLVVHDFLVEKKEWEANALLDLMISVPQAARLLQEDHFISPATRTTAYSVLWNYDARSKRSLSPALYEILKVADGSKSARQILTENGQDPELQQDLAKSLFALWSDRLVILRPSESAA
jgi:carbamoyltransferase